MSDKASEGWHRPPGSRKFHYFTEGGTRALCMRYGFAFGAELQPDEGTSKDDCAVCRKKLDKRQASGLTKPAGEL